LLFNDSLKCTLQHCVVGAILHFKFPKVVLAHILDEVGTFCILSLSVYPRMCLPMFTEIGLYLTDREPKNKLDRSFETR